jgi:hypothetical protein
MSKNLIFILLTGAALTTATPAVAEDVSIDSTPLVSEVDTTDAVQMPAFDLGDPNQVSDDELTDLRGGETIVVGNQTLVAITSGNIINGNYTAGNVSLSDNALSGFNGLGNVLINTGAQVSLQTGMNVTINVGD